MRQPRSISLTFNDGPATETLHVSGSSFGVRIQQADGEGATIPWELVPSVLAVMEQMRRVGSV